MKPVTIIVPDSNVKIVGIMHFIHGMQEHRKRYDHVLKHFSQLGYICAISDMRGHGENIRTKDDLGYFSARGDKVLINEVILFNEYLRKVYPGLPLIMVGHSMGSLVAKTFIKKHSREIDALIVCGSPSYKFGAVPGIIVINILAFLKGWRYRSSYVTNKVVGVFDKPFKKQGIKNSWLTRDEAVVDAFNRDELCGFPFTLNGYKTLFNLVISAYSREGWKNKKLSLPIMYISGGDDASRINDKKWADSVNFLKSVGFKNIFSKLYPGMRHELFNEFGKEEVFNDINKFLEINLGLDLDMYN